MKRISIILCLAFFLCFTATNVLAESVLGTTQTHSNYGYGGAVWSTMTAALDTATNNSFDTVADFENLSLMLTYDALWLDVRDTSDTLTATEYSNIQAFIATGKRVVMIGENNSWTGWNQQIVGMNGGSYAGQTASGTANSVISNALTNGAPTVYLPAGGVVASGGTALYFPNFATLWGDNVLTILDVNVFENDSLPLENNSVFATNVANWIAGLEPAPPAQSIPTLNEWGMIIFMLLAGITAAFYLRKGHMPV